MTTVVLLLYSTVRMLYSVVALNGNATIYAKQFLLKSGRFFNKSIVVPSCIRFFFFLLTGYEGLNVFYILDKWSNTFLYTKKRKYVVKSLHVWKRSSGRRYLSGLGS